MKLDRGLGRRSDYVAGEHPAGPVGEVDFGIGACQVFRRSVFDEVGGLDETIFYGPEDVDFCLRAKAAGHRVVQVDGSGVVHPARRTNRRLLTRSGSPARLAGRAVPGEAAVALKPVKAASPGAASVSARLTAALQPAKAIVLSDPWARSSARSSTTGSPCSAPASTPANDAIAPGTKVQILLRLYERHEIRFIREQLRSDLDIVELGASIGVTGSFLRRRLDPGAASSARQAHPGLLPTLRTNLGARPGDDRVVVEHGAVDYGEDSVRLTVGETTDGSAVEPAAAVGGAAVIEVPVIHLADLLRATTCTTMCWCATSRGPRPACSVTNAAALDGCRQLLIELHDGEMTIPELGVGGIEELGFVLRDESKRAKLYDRAPVVARVAVPAGSAP